MTDVVDHLMTFPNEEAAFGVLSLLGFARRNEANVIVWKRSVVDPGPGIPPSGIQMITADVVLDTTVFPAVVITPEQTIAGFHITIALHEASDELATLPSPFLRMIENRGLATASSKFHEYAASHANLPEGVASDMPPGQINRVGGVIENLKFRINPRFFGSDYPDPPLV